MSEAEETSLPQMNFSRFLETTPPDVWAHVPTIAFQSGGIHQISMPDIDLFCDNEICNGYRRHETSVARTDSRITVNLERYLIDAICKNCDTMTKTYAILAKRDDGQSLGGVVYKMGEVPPFGERIPNRLLRLLDKQAELFLKGRQSENHGLGIAAFTYYRRVVESQKVRLLERIVEVAKKTRSSKDMIDLLQRAQAEPQFSQSMEMVKDAVPPVLLINGHNPIGLLYSALSEGMHADTDEECLQIAQDIRIVLAEVAETAAQVLKDEKELIDAVNRLAGKQRARQKNEGIEDSPKN